MARITLRDYNKEINDLIDHGQTEEAISHCRHILKLFPRHVDTYRLLGKAYLEQQRYGDAADILQRVLSSVPDDFISQIGMSIIREDEMNLDAAIYHMELAFESQPSNHAIQDELRRLFAKRDGMEPPRIRLTRGALARMYAHGNLFEQAISEIQTALSEEPDRYDLQTLLAEMYNQVDKKIEAAETCTRILEKLPNNLEANRLLAMILSERGREEEAKAFKQRWEALDPYAAYVDDKNPKIELVPDDAVTVDHENWEPTYGGALGGDKPAWATSLGVDIEGEEAPAEVPDWLSEPGEGFPEEAPAAAAPMMESDEIDWMAAETSSSDSPFGSPGASEDSSDWMAEFSSPETPEAEASTDDWMSEFSSPTESEPEDPAELWGTDDEEQSSADDEAEIPDFMKEAGWGESSGESEEPASILEQPDEPIAEGDIPDWMQEMAPSENGTPPTPDLGAMGDVKAEGDPDWLQSVNQESQEEQPDWLSDLGETEQETPDSTVPSREVDPAGYLAGDFGEDDTDDWLASLSADAAPTESPSEAGEEDFLSGFQSEEVSEQPQVGGGVIPEHQADPAGYLAGDFGEDDTDDWLASLSASQPTGETTEQESFGSSEEPTEDEEDQDDWLGSLAAAADETAAEEVDGMAVPSREADPAGYLAGDFGEDDTDDWLASLSASQDAPAAPQPVSEASAEDEDDDWLASLSTEASAEEAPADDFGAIFDQEEPTPREAPAALESSPLDMEDEGMAWLESLAAKQGVAEEELVTSADEREAFGDDFTPSFLSQEQAEPSESDALPDFSAGFDQPEEAPAVLAVPESSMDDEDDLPMDWLDSISQEAAAEAGAIPESAAEPEEDDLSSLFGEPQAAAESPTEDNDALDWLQQVGGEAQPEPETTSDDLSAIFGESEAAPAPAAEAPVLDDEDDLSMDWLDSISEEAAAEAAADAGAVPEAAAEPEEDDFSSLFGEPQAAEESPTGADDALDWLQQVGGEAQPKPETDSDDLSAIFGESEAAAEPEEDDLSSLFGEPQAAAESPTEDDDALDWLQQVGGEGQPEPEIESDDLSAIFGESEAVPTPAAESPIQEEDDDFSMDWLDSISQEAAAEAGAVPEEASEPEEDDFSSLFGEPQAAAESPTEDDDALDWLQQVGGEAQPEPETQSDDLSAIFGESEAAPTPAAETPVLDDEDDLSMDWLDSISQEAAAEAGAVPEATAEPEEDDFSSLFGEPQAAAESPTEDDDALDWLQQVGGETEPEPDAAETIRDPLPLEDISAAPGDTSEDETLVDFKKTLEPESEETPTPSDQQDEGLAWLESLASKHGAAEEELVTTPDERSSFADDRTPDWLKELEEESPETAETPAAEAISAEDLDDLDALLDEVEEITDARQIEQADVFEDEDDFSMDWLDSISQEAASEAGAEAAAQPEAPIESEKDMETGELDLESLFGEENIKPTTAPEFEVEGTTEDSLDLEEIFKTEDELDADEADTSPEWMKIIQDDKEPKPIKAPIEPGLEAEPAAEITPPPVEPAVEAVEEIEDLSEPEGEAETGDVLEEQDDFSMEWLDTISQEAAAEAGVEEQDLAAAPVEQPSEETPDWLTSIEEEDDEEAMAEGLEDLNEIFGAEAQPAAPDDDIEPKETLVPEWLQEIADDKPSAEPIPEPEWLPEVEEPQPQAAPPVQEAEQQPEVKESPQPVEEQPAAAPMEEAKPAVPAEAPVEKPAPAPSEALTAAHQAVQRGDLDDAIKEFTKVIKKGKQLDEVITQVKEALRRHPVNVELWQVLGDAYMKANNLQDALDAYSKAENLLR